MADYAIHDTTLTDIANKIRKKDGTSALIDPADYADRIDLMGMLEVKSASKASICTFPDGADDVPIESGTFYVVPSQAGTGTPSPSNPRAISGYTGMNIVHTGKNLLNYADITDSYRITSITDNGGGSYTVVASNNSAWIQHLVPVKAGQEYSIKCSSATNDEGNASQIGVVDVFDGDNDTATKLLNGASISSRKGFTPSGNYVLVRNRVTGGSGAGTGTINQPQLEVGNSATAFELFKSIETLSVSWQTEAGTVYGGELNVTTGVLTVTYASETYNGDEAWSAYASGNGYARTVTGMASGTYYNDAMVMCDIFAKQPDNSNLGVRVGVANSNIYVVQANTLDGVSDATTFRTWLSTHNMTFTYKLSTPTTYQLTPHELRTFLGANNFYCDTGDSQINYRALGTTTPIQPTLVTKTITENGTYDASDDGADGYSEVVVNVPSRTPFNYEYVRSGDFQYVFTAMEEGDYLCVLYCSFDGTRTFSTTGTLIFEEDINVTGDSRGIKIALCHLLPNQQISHQATSVSLYNSRLQAIIRLDNSISVSQMVDSYAINDGNTSGYTPSYSGNVLSVAVCGGNNTEHFYDKTIPSDSAIENSVNGGLNSILHIGYGACPNYDMYGYYGNGVFIGLFQ